jgi:hypothetical protein
MPRAIALLLTVLVLGLAGCGGGDDKSKSSGGTATTSSTSSSSAASTEDYKRKVTTISSSFAQAGAAFAGSVSPTSTPQQAAAALETFQGKVEKAAADLDAVTPPAKVADAHTKLVSAFKRVAAACQPSIDAGKSGDRTKLRAELQKLRAKLNGSLGNSAKSAAQQIDAGLR